MSWARFECDMGEHAKWMCLSAEAFRFAVLLSCWAQKQAQLGRPTTIMPALTERLGGTRHKALVKELEEAGRPVYGRGLLDPIEGGWEVHDLPDYVPTATKAMLSEAGKKGAAKRWGKSGQANG